MNRVLILGNSASGKSTLAKRMCESHSLAHLDLDTLAWRATTPPERELRSVSAKVIDEFTASSTGWVIEGCYADLMELALSQSTELVFMNLPVKLCIANAQARPWEPHKYVSKVAQDANLSVLIEWIIQYWDRKDSCSYASHSLLYENYVGKKTMYTRNQGG